MNEQERELATRDRQAAELQSKKMVARAQQDIEAAGEHPIDEEARELLTRERQENEHLQENALERAQEALEAE